ncbi:MAG: hypothetical protein ACI31W_04440 [Lactococcus sp.]
MKLTKIKKLALITLATLSVNLVPLATMPTAFAATKLAAVAWTTAPNGYVFVNMKSGKYFSAVKYPSHYVKMLRTKANARGFAPGHSNGTERR